MTKWSISLLQDMQSQTSQMDISKFVLTFNKSGNGHWTIPIKGVEQESCNVVHAYAAAVDDEKLN